MSNTYTMTDEERKIVMLAMAGYGLDNDERKAIRPLYMRMLSDSGADLNPNLATAFDARDAILGEITAERRSQDLRWGGALHDDEHSRGMWGKLIAEHNQRVKKNSTKANDRNAYRKELVEVAALAVAAIEAHDRKVKVGR